MIKKMSRFTKMTRKQAEAFVQQFDATAYARFTDDRRSAMVSLPEFDIAGYGGCYENALFDLHAGSYVATPETEEVLVKIRLAVKTLRNGPAK